MRSLTRRDFLACGAVSFAGLGLSSLTRAATPGAQMPRVRRFRELGGTGMKISDVSFGASRLRTDENLVRYAFDCGINYFDTADSYAGGSSETTLGRALKGKRDRVYLTSKTLTGGATSRGEMMVALEGSLQRLQTDHLDIYFNHAVNDVARLSNPEWSEFVAEAKRQGKIRFAGMSGHAGKLVECLDFAIDHKLVDVVLVAYNFGQDPAFYQRFLKSFDMVAIQPDLPRVLAKAKTAGIGVVAMKTLMGARLNDLRRFEEPGGTFAQAAFRWVLSNSDVDALIVSMTSREQVDEYLGASGSETVAAKDLALLARYVSVNSSTTCRFGCDACSSSCPAGVSIADVLRVHMYAEDYGDRRMARDEYARIDEPATACLSCAAQPCAGACPHGVPIPEFTRRVATRLA
jgi:predicted aldo/keto reductase-like oxidoreductase